MNQLNGKRTLLLGGSKGIGKATVLALAREGAQVVFTYKSNDALADAMVVGSAADGLMIKCLRSDLSNLLDTENSFTWATEQLGGKIQLLVINAFPPPVFMPTEVMDEHGYDAMFAATRGTYFALQQAAKNVEDGGSIIVISSGAAINPQYGNGAYAGAKAAIERFAMSLAKELGNRQVSVNCISPGFTKTEDFNAPDQMVQMITSLTPFGRLGTAEDIANAIVALAQPASKWITGQIIQVNGGIF
jgi:3-oxoacyl-[acyl-carrier protein] reductase